MSSVAKRRNPTRRKTARAAASVDRPVGPSWLNEAFAILLLAVALLLTLGVVSYTLEDPDVGPRSNWLGPTGHLLATILFGAFGWSSLLIVGFFGYLGYRLWGNELAGIKEGIKKLPSRFVARSLGLMFALVCTATICAVLFGRSGGGAIGEGIATPLVNGLNPVGTSILSAGLLLVALALATGNSIQTLLMGFGSGVFLGAKFLFTVLPVLVWRCIAFGASGFFGFFTAILGAEAWGRVGSIFVSPAPKPPKEQQLPKPRVRRNSISREATPSVESVDEVETETTSAKEIDTKQESQDYSHVVVMRRDIKPEKIERKKVAAPPPTPAFTDINDAFPNYEHPDLGLLTKGEPSVGSEDDEELRQKSRQIEVKLKDFGIFGRVTQVHPGPVITLFEFEPAPGVKVGKIAALQDDLAMSLKASSIRIIAPIPKRGTVGIEVPNRNRDTVRLRDVLESKQFIEAESILTIGMGKDTYGDPVSVDIAQMPHLLMAGSTGTGKSVCINAILLSLLYRAHPSDLGLILIDPKILELSTYEDIPHLRVPVVTVPRQARAVLEWAVHEMDRRYRLMQRFGVRNIDGYNRIARGEEEIDPTIVAKEQAEAVEPVAPEAVGEGGLDSTATDASGQQPLEPIVGEVLRPLPKIVIVIDELADLMLTVGREVEELITRLAQKARASGIHLILATQRPSVDVITGLIKANFPARLSFRVSSRIDSRTILDSMGAERLLGRGDMLFMLPGAEAIRRVHGAFVSDAEVKRVVEAIKRTAKPCYDERIMHLCKKALEENKQEGGEDTSEDEYDAVYDRAVELVMQKGQASTSMLQRAFRIGYNRAARIIELMERDGVIGPMDGAKPREVLLTAREEAS
jgi:S-DNA-T family DNA segregation ATPase FtsK/SpoIIIE